MFEFSIMASAWRYRRAANVGRSRRADLLIHGFASTHAVNWFSAMVKTLTGAGRRVIALTIGAWPQREIYDPAAYATQIMAEMPALLDHLHIECRCDGYSMGARIAAFLAKAHKSRLRSMILGGLGYHWSIAARYRLPSRRPWKRLRSPMLPIRCSGCSAASPRRPRVISRRSPHARAVPASS